MDTNVVFHDRPNGGYYCNVCKQYIHPDMISHHNAPNHGGDKAMTNPNPSAQPDELEKILTAFERLISLQGKINVAKNQGGGEVMMQTGVYLTKRQALTALRQREARLLVAARDDELKKATVGRVTNSKNRNNKTYMSGFGYAANNLQAHKVERLIELAQLKMTIVRRGK